jgi:hypothetical protein
MSDLIAIDNQLLEIFKNEKALEVLKSSLAANGLTIYSAGSVLHNQLGPDSQAENILASIKAAEQFLNYL